MSKRKGPKEEADAEDRAAKKVVLSRGPKPTMRLNTGAVMPTVQLGTYRMKGEVCKAACRAALLGPNPSYTGLDTASIYGNEATIAPCLAAAPSGRDSLFVQTKLWRAHQGSAKAVHRALQQSLRNLGLAYVDLWLLHWPGPGRHLHRPPVRKAQPVWRSPHREPIKGNDEVRVPADWTPTMRHQTWRHMASHTGPHAGARAIGVCNFSARQLEDLIVMCDAEGLPLPAVVQNECHPMLPATAVRAVCERRGIVFQAYASLGSGVLDLSAELAVRTVASAHGKTAAQVLLRWALQHGCAVVPKSRNPARQQENADVWGFELNASEMGHLDALSVQPPGNQMNTMVGWLREYDPDRY